ncbi:hypothetical protein A9Q74_07575 [Colwellia sp. 39_35_sub15_T18]|nr:hypothetical protein A9Q74_07575 [Colwellia sp. 39_35_sub15_T18]
MSKKNRAFLKWAGYSYEKSKKSYCYDNVNFECMKFDVQCIITNLIERSLPLEHKNNNPEVFIG